MGKMNASEIAKRLMTNPALFADIHIVSKKFYKSYALNY